MLELTSRVNTGQVATTKSRLAKPFADAERIDTALATNMISVGLDITRLGLMMVLGQPKTSAEYIQATSRVGRDPRRPGLVVTIFNIHKPRDRSHYERFSSYHASFYRAVEATSVTPFSPRALDRALVGTLVALVRHFEPRLTPPRGAELVPEVRNALTEIANRLADRARAHAWPPTADAGQAIHDHVLHRCTSLLDDWVNIVEDLRQSSTHLEYQKEYGGGAQAALQLPRPRTQGRRPCPPSVQGKPLDAGRRTKCGAKRPAAISEQIMAQPQLRRSQLVTTFGPGCMIDLPDNSVIVAGLDHWRYDASRIPVIEEPRLTEKLRALLDRETVTLRTPPPAPEHPSEPRTDVTAWEFPTGSSCRRSNGERVATVAAVSCSQPRSRKAGIATPQRTSSCRSFLSDSFVPVPGATLRMSTGKALSMAAEATACGSFGSRNAAPVATCECGCCATVKPSDRWPRRPA